MSEIESTGATQMTNADKAGFDAHLLDDEELEQVYNSALDAKLSTVFDGLRAVVLAQHELDAKLIAELETRLSGQTCFVPPEFQKQLDGVIKERDGLHKQVAMQREALIDLEKLQRGDLSAPLSRDVFSKVDTALAATAESSEAWMCDEIASRLGEHVCEKSMNGLEWVHADTVDRLPEGAKLYAIYPDGIGLRPFAEIVRDSAK